MVCFDPRDGEHKDTDNPALIFAAHAVAMGDPDEMFWQRIAELADYCEETVDG